MLLSIPYIHLLIPYIYLCIPYIVHTLPHTLQLPSHLYIYLTLYPHSDENKPMYQRKTLALSEYCLYFVQKQTIQTLKPVIQNIAVFMQISVLFSSMSQLSGELISPTSCFQNINGNFFEKKKFLYQMKTTWWWYQYLLSTSTSARLVSRTCSDTVRVQP